MTDNSLEDAAFDLVWQQSISAQWIRVADSSVPARRTPISPPAICLLGAPVRSAVSRPGISPHANCSRGHPTPSSSGLPCYHHRGEVGALELEPSPASRGRQGILLPLLFL